MKLTGHTILISGGTSGIGLELGRVLLQKNNRVILLGTNQEKLKKLKEEGFETLSCDLSNVSEIEAASIQIQHKYPNINMLFNNAGVQFNYSYPNDAIQPDKIYRETAINFSGQVVFTQLILPILLGNERATIVNTTSGLAYYPKNDGLVYSATKAAFHSFTIGLRNTLKPLGVKVIEFIPPVTDTGMTQGRQEEKMSPKVLALLAIEQMEKGNTILSIRKLRLFPSIAFFFPKVAYKIIN